MPEIFSKYVHKVVEFWKGLDKSQKKSIYITAVILAVAVAVGLFLLTRSNYITVVSSNDSNEINEMRKVLSDDNITHKLSSDRSSILVDSKDKNKAELTLALQGYPKGGMTFEDAWSQIKINTTESDKKKLWEEYKKKSLIAKLKMLSNVKDADVDIALPEPSLFQSEQKPTAYVIVTPKEELTKEQVEGIVMIVSRSVENLDPENVTVVDNYANILNSETGNNMMAKTSSQLQAQLNKGLELEKRVYNLFGGSSDNYDTIKVVVNPVLDFNTQKSQSQVIEKPENMDEGYIISRQEKTEDLQNGTAGGEAGIGSNPGTIDTTTYKIGSDGTSSYSKRDITENFEYSRTVIDQEKAVGVLDPEKSSMTVALWYGRKVTDENKLSQEFIDGLVVDVSKATGIPASNIAVSKHKLAPLEVQKDSTSDKVKDIVDTYGIYALLLLLVIGLIVAFLAKGRREMDTEAQLAAPGIPAGVAVKAYMQDTVKEPLPEIEVEEKSEVKKQIDRFVKQKPDAVAQLLRNWLSDEWE